MPIPSQTTTTKHVIVSLTFLSFAVASNLAMAQEPIPNFNSAPDLFIRHVLEMHEEETDKLRIA